MLLTPYCFHTPAAIKAANTATKTQSITKQTLDKIMLILLSFFYPMNQLSFSINQGYNKEAPRNNMFMLENPIHSVSSDQLSLKTTSKSKIKYEKFAPIALMMCHKK
jgi:hypothetical protein